jgi:hypothetical protein
MSALPALKVVLAPALDVFEARCQARAHLCIEGEMELHEAIDELQDYAVASGLLDQLGQDAIQRMLAEAFTTVPRLDEAVKLIREITDFIETMPRTRSSVPTSTIQAARYLMKQGDPGALDAWLAQRSARECAAILQALKRH